MKFRISTGLKNIIGKDLITDDNVAIFELVKNAYDAYANRVDLYFGDDVIYVIDNGKGMSKVDIEKKWLFVAYSAKADETEDKGLRKDYRSDLRAKRSHFAGNKGVGRFSCDRLGDKLQIQSKKSGSKIFHQLIVDWDDFEEDHANEFSEIDLHYKKIKKFNLPSELNYLKLSTGTILKIEGLRNVKLWDRKLLRLRSDIAKLIDPFGMKKDFLINIHAPKYLVKDRETRSEYRKKKKLGEEISTKSPYYKIVNGPINNLIFDNLSIKTTRIECAYKEDGYIYTKLIDRGETVYRIKEKNRFHELVGNEVSILIYFMNKVAKSNFTKVMGIDNVNFGSLFLFNNGFRVFPVGEPGVDTFGLDYRKQQGMRRYLGTRDIVGKIELGGDFEKYKETSSRGHGLTRTDAYSQLEELLLVCIKRLEAYVVGVTWKEKSDKESEDISLLLNDSGKSRVAKVLSSLIRSKNVEVIEYSQKLLDVVDERSKNFSKTIKDLQKLAKRSGSKELQKKIDQASKKYEKLKIEEKRVQRELEQERKNREETEKLAKQEKIRREKAEKEARESAERAKEAEIEAEKFRDESENKTKESIFLRSMVSANIDNVVALHHHIGIAANTIENYVKSVSKSILSGKEINREKFLSVLHQISLVAKQIVSTTRFATKANFTLEAEIIEQDLLSYLEEYVLNVCSGLVKTKKDIQKNVIFTFSTNKKDKFITKFRPLQMSIVLDSLISNSVKAGSENIEISAKIEKGRLKLNFKDDGRGVKESEISKIFDLGYTTTRGSGFGLHHVKSVMSEIKGNIELFETSRKGTEFILNFSKG